MDKDQLQRGNEIQEEIQNLNAQVKFLEENIRRRKSDRVCSIISLKFINDRVRKNKNKDNSSGLIYWTMLDFDGDRLIELDLDDVILLKESKQKRIEVLQNEFNGL